MTYKVFFTGHLRDPRNFMVLRNLPDSKKLAGAINDTTCL